MWLPHFVFTCWSPATPDETCFVVAQLLVLFGNLAPGMSVTKRMIDGAWGTLGYVVVRPRTFVFTRQPPDRWVWLRVCQGVRGRCCGWLAAGDEEPRAGV